MSRVTGRGDIPQTAQYACNCFPGCGEFNIFEALVAGDDKMTSSFRGPPEGGGRDPNYFRRPVDGPVKVAVVFGARSRLVAVTTLDEGFVFEEVVSETDVRRIVTGCNDAVGSVRMVLDH